MKDKKIKVFLMVVVKSAQRDNYYNKHDKNNKFNWIDLNSRVKI